MKLLLSLSLFILFQNGLEASIIPSRSVYSFLDIFHSKNRLQENNFVEVRATEYDKHGNLQGSKSKINVPRTQFEQFRKEAAAVFRVIPTEPSADGVLYQGTAFHIGHNLLLTNHHVLSREFTNFTKCDTFQIKDNNNNFHRCSKVHFCSNLEDVCLIEVSSRRQIAPALKIQGQWQPSSEETLINAIGNSQGHGIHLSQARGLKNNSANYVFYSAIRDGNSGGPILQDGKVIGIARTESKDIKLEGSSVNTVSIMRVQRALRAEAQTLAAFNQAVLALKKNPYTQKESDEVNLNRILQLLKSDPESLQIFERLLGHAGGRAYNNAASSVVFIQMIRNALSNDPETLEKFNQSVLE